MKLNKVIISRGRADMITTHMVIKDAVLVVPDDEIGDYPDSLEKVAIPSTVHGLGAVRNWVLDHFDSDVVMFDDDITKVYNISRVKGRYILDPELIAQIIDNTYQVALDIGAKAWGFNQTFDVRKYTPHEPFLMCSWMGGAIGIIGRDLKFTEINKGKVDIDYCLQNLMKHRKVWIDNRFGFIQKRDSNKGGSSLYRTREKMKGEMAHLKDKWGKHIVIGRSRTKETIRINVQRKQKIIL